MAALWRILRWPLAAAFVLWLFGPWALLLVSVYSHPSWLLAGLTAAFVAAVLAIRRLDEGGR